ncbi:MAG: molecular chaperone HtpG [Ruminococcaceae bacterium]|nr:molecular chaperone HtpG [Oscillospiraceae bacterium]
MRLKQFKAESKKLLDLMINSIYTNKEIFLRELISNSSDAIDKLRFKSLTDESVKISASELRILLTIDKDARTITISDNGIGMTKEELENNLGTIAKSGSLDFKKENKDESIDIIGQFGVGFYSAFMIASKVSVTSRAFGEDKAYVWQSEGALGYTIEEASKDTVGTDIVLTVKEDTENENYSRFLEEYGIVEIVKKYSDYVRYPIMMERTKSRMKDRPEDADENYKNEYETYRELETLNSMIPLWKRKKSDVSDDEYTQFYKDTFYDYEAPAKVIKTESEGLVSYTSLLFIPSHAPFDFYSKEYKKGLALYTSGVMIMEKCADLLPDYFSFVRGVVDSADLSLNISREILQKDHQLKTISKNIEKKIKNELSLMLVNEREKYEEFFKAFGRMLKFGVYSDYGMNREKLQDLLIFYSAKQEKMITLDEYVSSMPEGQKYIYFAAGDSAERLAKLPSAEAVTDHGYDLLLCTEDIDEFCLQMLRNYKEKDFKNIGTGDLGLETDEEKEELKNASEEAKSLFDLMKNTLKDKVCDIRLSSKLKEHPVSLSSDGPVSIEMEKVLKNMPGSEGMISAKVLELNANHKIFETLKNANESGDFEKVEKYTKLLYNQALLIEGLKIDDPIEYAKAVCELMN